MSPFCAITVNTKVCYVCLFLIRRWSLKICFPAVYCIALCQKRVCAVTAGAHLTPAHTAQCLTRFYQMISCSAALHLTTALSPLALATSSLFPTCEVSHFIVTNKSIFNTFLFFIFFITYLLAILSSQHMLFCKKSSAHDTVHHWGPQLTNTSYLFAAPNAVKTNDFK